MHCVKLLGQRLSARRFDRQVAEFQVRVAVLNRFTALGIPVTPSCAKLSQAAPPISAATACALAWSRPSLPGPATVRRSFSGSLDSPAKFQLIFAKRSDKLA